MTTDDDILSPSFSFDKHQSFRLDFDPDLAPSINLDEEPATDEEEEEVDETSEKQEPENMGQIEVPRHPIPAMQEAFAESMLEASAGPSTPNIAKLGDSTARRKLLLDQAITEDTHASRWRQKPGQQWHQLWKLMAQISFGIYLLLNGMAKNDEQVLTILQGHVDEVDEFLEATLDDFDLAQEDIDERLKNLMLPLQNIDVFDKMLENREYRLDTVNGNERIEHIITRTAKAMNDALQDVQQGLEATKVFASYLAKEQNEMSWQNERPDMQRVFDAMKGNADGWHKAYVSLQTKGNHLGVALVQLGSIVAEMDRRAGEVSRRMRFSITPDSSQKSTTSSPPSSPPNKSHRSKPSASSMSNSITKELPSDPAMITPAIRATLPAFQYVGDRIRTPEHDEDSSIEPEEELEPEQAPTLRPVTYMPDQIESTPSVETGESEIPLFPQPPSTPISEIFPMAAHRTRFNIRRKSDASSKTKNSPPNVLRKSPPASTMPPPAMHQTMPMATPLSSGTDSAYFSSNSGTTSPAYERQSFRTPHASNSYGAPSPPLSFPSPSPPIGSPSARSSSQLPTFHPVPSNPNSPLQRPWTAAPLNHHYRQQQQQQHYYPSGGPHTNNNLRNSSGTTTSQKTSRTTMTSLSQMTSATTDTAGRQVKKKKSGFGWLKKAFSLSEEEKAAFEERRRAPVPPTRPARATIVDGRRVRQI